MKADDGVYCDRCHLKMGSAETFVIDGENDYHHSCFAFIRAERKQCSKEREFPVQDIKSKE